MIDGVHDVANEFTCDTRKKDQGKAFKHELITFSSRVPCSALAAGIRKEGGPTIVYAIVEKGRRISNDIDIRCGGEWATAMLDRNQEGRGASRQNSPSAWSRGTCDL